MSLRPRSKVPGDAAEGVDKSALAKRLEVALPQIDGLLDLGHGSRLDPTERALKAAA
jgi:hypothetical protein